MQETSFLDVVFVSFANLWDSFIGAAPKFLGALLIVIIGWLIAAWLGRLVKRVFKFVDTALEKTFIMDWFKERKIDFTIAGLLGWLVKWFGIVYVFIVAADVLQWTQLTVFLNKVVDYLPSVAIAIVILVIGVIVADFADQVVHKAVKAAKVRAGDFLGALAKWSILVFALIAALNQLNIATTLVNTIVTGVVAMLALAGGLAFGLGGRDAAKDAIDRIKKDFGVKK